MTRVPLLDRVQGELRRRTGPRPKLLDYLRDEELRELRAALRAAHEGSPLDAELVSGLERRARVRHKIGLRLTVPGDPSFRPDPAVYWPCPVLMTGETYCDCGLRALDERRIATRQGLMHYARQFHNKRHPSVKPEPEWRPPPRLARVLPFRSRKPREESVAPEEPEQLDPALQSRAPLESIEQLATRIGVALMPTPPEEDR